jgi:mono/diheme cytochrome c family protein
MRSNASRRLWLGVAVLTVLVATGFATRKPAESIPLFATSQGVSCSQCHNAPPNLNAYGRYILATNFGKVLNAHAQMVGERQDPVSVIVAGNGSNPSVPGLPSVYLGEAQLNSAGYLGKDVTYYASVPIVDGGFPSQAIDQVWAAYNGFSRGNGSLQVGKFPTPFFAPWLSQSLSLSGYALAAMPVGLNTVGVGDNRWGASYTQIGATGLIANVAYLTNTGPVERAYDGSMTNTTASAEGQSYVASLQQMNIGSHFTGGVATMSGNFPLPSGAQDAYTRTMALLSYSTASNYDLIAMALVGHDGNPNDGASPASGSNGISFEGIVSPRSWLHLDARYERTNDGLGTVQTNYVGDVAFSIMQNLILTLENVSTVGAKPTTSYQLLYGGPWVEHRRPTVVGMASASASANPGASPSTATTPAVLASGKQIFAANCAACHGASGQGGFGPNLHGIAARKTSAATIAFIENPAGAMPKLYPATISASQVADVAAYIETFK